MRLSIIGSLVALLAVPSAFIAGAGASAGCGGASAASQSPTIYDVPLEPPTQLTVERTFFIPGEQMWWNISLRGIVGGEAVMVVGQPGSVDGHNAIIARSQTKTAGLLALIKEVRDDVTTWIDLDTGLPIRHKATLKFGKKESDVATEFNDLGYVIDYHRHGSAAYKRGFKMPEGTVAHDGHTIIGMLRGWEADEGTRAFFYVLSGRRLWRNDVLFRERATLRTATGTHPVIRIDGVAVRLNNNMHVDRRKRPRRYTVWISDDANRLPVRVDAATEYGRVKIEMVRYERPERRIAGR